MARSRAAHPGGASGVGAIMKFFNRQINTYRGTVANLYGDETDVGIPYLTGVQAALAETEQTVFDAASQRQQTVRGLTCTVPNWVDIIDTDTVQDPATGNYYLIESMELMPGIGMYPPLKILTLRMRSGVSTSSD